MNHEDALREMAVEKYLLGELPDEARDTFEEHFFECAICAADLKDGAILFAAAKEEAKQPARSTPSLRVIAQRRGIDRVRPWLLIAALAASLLVMIYQNLLVLPAMRQTVARAEAPEVLNNLVLANVNARGDTLPEIATNHSGSFLISVDIPPRSGFASYRCSLYAPTGSLLWQLPISLQQAENTVSLRAPSGQNAEGIHVLVVEGIPLAGTGDAHPVEVGRYRFRLRAQ